MFLSFFILSGTFFASGVGTLATITIVPWIGTFGNADILPALFTGWAVSSLLSSFAGILQEPGTQRRFSPTVKQYNSFFCQYQYSVFSTFDNNPLQKEVKAFFFSETVFTPKDIDYTFRAKKM